MLTHRAQFTQQEDAAFEALNKEFFQLLKQGPYSKQQAKDLIVERMKDVFPELQVVEDQVLCGKVTFNIDSFVSSDGKDCVRVSCTYH